jgi:hypothetical protein
LKRFPSYGIYIIMAKKIFVTFLKVPNQVEFFPVYYVKTAAVKTSRDTAAWLLLVRLPQ